MVFKKRNKVILNLSIITPIFFIDGLLLRRQKEDAPIFEGINNGYLSHSQLRIMEQFYKK